jgi:hypothetical protein
MTIRINLNRMCGNTFFSSLNIKLLYHNVSNAFSKSMRHVFTYLLLFSAQLTSEDSLFMACIVEWCSRKQHWFFGIIFLFRAFCKKPVVYNSFKYRVYVRK